MSKLPEVQRVPARRMPTQSRGHGTRRLRLEILEARTLLTVVANDDNYAATEDTPPNTAPVTVIPQYASGWYVNDELMISDNQYPVDGAGRHWTARDYDINTSRIDPYPSIWDGPITGPFDCQPRACEGHVNAFDGVPVTLIEVPPAAENTFLLRRTFILDPALAAARWGRITYTCDSGCIIYINGVRAASSPNMVDILSPTPNTFALDVGDEILPHANASFRLNSPGEPPLYEGQNVLAAEVHNDSTASEDSGGDFSLALAPVGGSVLTNDYLRIQTGDLVLMKLTDPVDDVTGQPAGTITLNTDNLSPDFGTFAYAPAANYCGSATWSYQIDDDSHRPSIASVAFDVECVNDAPLAADDFYSVAIGGVLNITAPTGSGGGLLANDTDVEGDTLIVETVDTSAVTAQGVLNVNTDGTFAFDPFPTAVPGAYTVTYRAVDNGTPSAKSNVATAQILITPGCGASSDLDHDGRVGSADLAILVAHFGSRSATPDQGDLDCDGKVGLSDLAAMKRQWRPAGASAAAAAIIEGFRLTQHVPARSSLANQMQRLSATRSGAAIRGTATRTLRQTERDSASADATPLLLCRTTRSRAGYRAIKPRRHAIDAALSAWEPARE